MQNMTQDEMKEQEQDFEIVKPWVLHHDGKTVAICIPKRLVERYNLKKQNKLFLIPKDDGILVKKADVKLD